MNQPSMPKRSGNPYIKTTFNSPISRWIYQHITTPLKRFLGLFEKELRVLFKDTTAMLIAFAIPILVIVILTVGTSQTLISNSSTTTQSSSSTLVKSVPTLGLINYDTSTGFPGRDLSNEMVQMFNEQRDEGNCYLYITTNQSDLEQMMGQGQLNAFIIIPQGFEFNLSIHFPSIITIVFDSIDTMGLQAAQSIVQYVVDTFKSDNNFTGVFQETVHNVNLPENSQTFYAAAPYLVPMILFAIGALTSTQSVVSDIPKDRMVLTPTNKKEMFAAKFMANFTLMMMNGFLMMIVSVFVNLQIRSTWGDFLLIVILITANAVSVGQLISAISRTPLAAFQYFVFFFLFQVIALFFLQDPNILNYIPVHNGYVLMLDVVLRGQNYWSVRSNIFNIVLETIIIYAIGYIVFRQQKNLL